MFSCLILKEKKNETHKKVSMTHENFSKQMSLQQSVLNVKKGNNKLKMESLVLSPTSANQDLISNLIAITTPRNAILTG